MNPCKYCIIQACCTTQCEPYKKFVSDASAIITFISVILSAIIVGVPLIYLTDFYPDQELAKKIILWVWILCFIFSITFKKLYLKEAYQIVFEMILGPFCTILYLFMFISAKIIKRV